MEINDVFTKQFDSYRLIYDKALTSIKKNYDKNDKLSDYCGLTKLKYDNDIEKKKREFHDLEVQIFSIKQNTIDTQAHLDDLKKNIILATAEVKEQSRRNFHMYNKNMSLK